MLVEKELPCIPAEDVDTPGRWSVQSKDDPSFKWFFRRDGDQWEVEPDPRVPIGATRLLFPTWDEAALFACMRYRAYQYPYEPAKDDPSRITRSEVKHIEVIVIPNFGQWDTCPIGEWVAWLYNESRTGWVGNHSYASSLEQAKLGGLQKASGKTNGDLLRIAQQEWKRVPDPRPFGR